MTELPHNQTADQERPKLYYGWYMLIVSTACMVCTSPGQSFIVGVFRPSIEKSLNLPAGQFTTAYMFATIAGALPLFVVGALMDRFGARWLVFTFALLLCLGCIVAGAASGFWTLLLGLTMLRMFGQASLGMLSGNILSLWFRKKLGFASGIMAAGMATSIALAPYGCNLLIQATDWRIAYSILGVVVLCILVPLVLFVHRNRPEDLGLEIDGVASSKLAPSDPRPDSGDAMIAEVDAGSAEAPRLLDHQPVEQDVERHFTLGEALQTRAFWIATGCFSWWALAMTAIMICASTVFEGQGLASAAAAGSVATMLLAMGLTLLASQLIVGKLADMFPIHRILAVGMLMLAVAPAGLALQGSYRFAILIGVMMAISQACVVATMGTIWARYYGRNHLGKIRGIVTKVLIMTSAFGPFGVELANHFTENYQHTFIGLAILPLPLIAAAMFATRPKQQ